MVIVLMGFIDSAFRIVCIIAVCKINPGVTLVAHLDGVGYIQPFQKHTKLGRSKAYAHLCVGRYGGTQGEMLRPRLLYRARSSLFLSRARRH